MRHFASMLVTGVAVLLSQTAACRSVDTSRLSSDGRELKEMEPIPYRVAVAPVDASGARANPASANGKSDLVFSLTYAQMQKKMVDDLNGLRASTAVVPVASTQPDSVRDARADLVILPRLTERPYLHRAGKERVALTTALWLTTWIGGLYVEDRIYDARIAVDFHLIDPHTGEVLGIVPASCDRVGLTFSESNKGSGYVKTILLPPYWAGENKEKASAALSDRMCTRLAGALTRYFKEDFVRELRPVQGEIRLLSPLNDARTGGLTRVKGVLIAAEPITELAIYHNDKPEPVLDLTQEKLPEIADQKRGGIYQVPFDKRLRLADGDNQIHFEFGIGGRLSSRTIVVHNKKEE